MALSTTFSSLLSQGLPGENPLLKTREQENKKLQMQQAVQQTATPQKVVPAAQVAGAQQVQSQGQVAAQSMAQGAEEASRLSKSFLEDERRAAQGRLREKALVYRNENLRETERLGSLDSRFKQNIFDKQMQFKEDELGRTLFSEQQLLDYKIANARSDEDLLNYEQQVRGESDRRIALLSAAHAKIRQALEQGFQSGEQELDQAHKENLIRAKAELEAKLRREEARNKNRAARFSAAGQILGATAGAIVGTVVAGPGGTAAGAAAGATAGASIGQGLGSLVYSSGYKGETSPQTKALGAGALGPLAPLAITSNGKI
jgi:hypothetical protein